jgi:Ca2+-binding EF-hand superfamily protein
VFESDLRALFKVLDIDKDTQISLEEFKRFFSLPNIPNIGKNIYKSPKRGVYESPKRSPQKIDITSSPRGRTNLNYESTSSPRRYPQSPNRRTSPMKSSNSNLENFPSVSPNRTKSSSYLSLEEENFNAYLKALFEIENEIERNKIELVLRSDFNIEDAFRIFELDGRGYLSDMDIKFGLNSLDILASSEEIQLLLMRYDLRGEGVLTYANFFEMMCPYDKEYRKLLEKRQPSNYVPKYNKADVFLSSTKILLQNLFNVIIKAETKLEGWRQKLNRLPRFILRFFFEQFDRLSKTYLEDEDVIFFLKRMNINYIAKDIDFLFLRYDKDRDGRISYSEVLLIFRILIFKFSSQLKFIQNPEKNFKM